jgi:hypothetical protein
MLSAVPVLHKQIQQSEFIGLPHLIATHQRQDDIVGTVHVSIGVSWLDAVKLSIFCVNT